MTIDSDDEALSWAGDEATAVAAKRAADAAASDSPQSDAPPQARPGTGSVMLVFLGVIGGVYLLYAVGWAVAVFRDRFTRDSLLAEIMAQFGEFLAIVAPLVWLAVTLLLTRDRPGVRIGWLLAGVVLLVPVPFVLGGN